MTRGITVAGVVGPVVPQWPSQWCPSGRHSGVPVAVTVVRKWVKFHYFGQKMGQKMGQFSLLWSENGSENGQKCGQFYYFS